MDRSKITPEPPETLYCPKCWALVKVNDGQYTYACPCGHTFNIKYLFTQEDDGEIEPLPPGAADH